MLFICATHIHNLWVTFPSWCISWILTGPCAWLLQLRNFNDLKYISFSAAVMSLGYSTIAIGASFVSFTLMPNTQTNSQYTSTYTSMATIQWPINRGATANVLIYMPRNCAGVTIHNGKQPGTVYNLDFLPSMSARVLSAFNSLGIIAFACVLSARHCAKRSL